MRRQVPLKRLLVLAMRLIALARRGCDATRAARTLGTREPGADPDAGHVARETSRLLAAVSHDLRQPLYALSLATESLVRHPERPPGRPLLLQMKSALQSADDLLDSLLIMARLDAGGLQPDMAEFSIQLLLDRVDAVFGPQAASKGLRWDVTPSIAKVRSDPVLLERMVGNLVSNAVRFTALGGVVVSCRRRGSSLLLQVWDTGSGIDAVHQGRVFEAFFRGVYDSEGDNGVGLGLAIVRSGALLLGIDVGLRSVPGRGSCFSLRVPMARSHTVDRAPDGAPQGLSGVAGPAPPMRR
jgi:signal transduction histidine kinase